MNGLRIKNQFENRKRNPILHACMHTYKYKHTQSPEVSLESHQPGISENFKNSVLMKTAETNH